ncbi:predicted glycosyltransferase [Alteracholeplasma palmae J233]|uniref:Predicted glycosyltransferase n=1 Tax=Alteracholeplasma palmae (strain ATCC 49389 / J233) TaxID=1318466 RepID=U4KLH2_ALTPJ|nr:glycosyltransferase [Alteracholeplasma palmae]CCV64692.1 predicted glycosyltransferase [Alteracholeplasma palmae J233]
MKKISIVIPVYNVEKYIYKCLNSVVQQTYSNLEIIIVNDGTKDDSMTVVEKFSKTDSRIKILNQENNGLSAARNKGLELATGEYVYFLDSDDYLEKEAISKMVFKMDEYGSQIVMFNSYIDYESYKEKYIEFNKIITLSGEDFLQTVIRKRIYKPTVWSYFYETAYLKTNEYQFQNGLIHEDEEWSIKVILGANKVTFFPEILHNYLKRMNSITSNKKRSKKSITDMLFILKLNEERVNYHVKIKKTCQDLFTRQYIDLFFQYSNNKKEYISLIKKYEINKKIKSFRSIIKYYKYKFFYRRLK